MAFQIPFPALSFEDFIAVNQVVRTYADGCDRKDAARLRASLAPTVTLDYTSIIPEKGLMEVSADYIVEAKFSAEHLGMKCIVSQHLLGQPYFISVSETEIVVEYQALASHGRKAAAAAASSEPPQFPEHSDGRWYLTFGLRRQESELKIAMIKTEVIYQVGDWNVLHRPETESQT